MINFSWQTTIRAIALTSAFGLGPVALPAFANPTPAQVDQTVRSCFEALKTMDIDRVFAGQITDRSAPDARRLKFTMNVPGVGPVSLSGGPTDATQFSGICSFKLPDLAPADALSVLQKTADDLYMTKTEGLSPGTAGWQTCENADSLGLSFFNVGSLKNQVLVSRYIAPSGDPCHGGVS